MENKEVTNVVEEVVESQGLNKAVIIGTVAIGGALLLVVAPRLVKKVKKLFSKKSELVTDDDDCMADNTPE